VFRPIHAWYAAFACLAVLTGCSSDDNSSSSANPTAASSSGSSAAQACERLVALIGYAEESLLPAGQENHQKFDDAARGGIAEAIGTAERYGSQLPASLQPAAERLVKDGYQIVPATTPRATQVASLRDYRQAADEIVHGCASFTDYGVGLRRPRLAHAGVQTAV
jgi:hypothetical protein